MPDFLFPNPDHAKASRLKFSASAKINLHLRVGPLAANGFHPLLSWICRVGLFDKLVFTSSTKTELRCSDVSLPCDSRNLVIRVVEVLHRELRARGVADADLPGMAIDLEKHIPMGGGLGGGSSDAACAFTALNGMWAMNITGRRLMELAAELGSDIPFFFSGTSTLCEGRGERITPIAPPKPTRAVLILPDLSMPTPAVYRKFDEMKLGSEAALKLPEDFANWSNLSAAELLPKLVNDLEAPAFAIEPRLARLRADCEQAVGQNVRMSGSGSTLFTICDESTKADAIADQIEQQLSMRTRVVLLARFE